MPGSGTVPPSVPPSTTPPSMILASRMPIEMNSVVVPPAPGRVSNMVKAGAKPLNRLCVGKPLMCETPPASQSMPIAAPAAVHSKPDEPPIDVPLATAPWGQEVVVGVQAVPLFQDVQPGVERRGKLWRKRVKRGGVPGAQVTAATAGIRGEHENIDRAQERAEGSRVGEFGRIPRGDTASPQWSAIQHATNETARGIGCVGRPDQADTVVGSSDLARGARTAQPIDISPHRSHSGRHGGLRRGRSGTPIRPAPPHLPPARGSPRSSITTYSAPLLSLSQVKSLESSVTAPDSE